MMIRIYNENSIKLIYLSPYVNVEITENRLAIYQTVFSCRVFLECSERFSHGLIDMLYSGVSEQELKEYLSIIMPPEQAEEFLNLWIQTGVLE